MSDDRIPTYLWIEAEIRRLSGEGIGVYVIARGDKMGGQVLQKISDMRGQCRLLLQQRNFSSGKMEWVNALEEDPVAEPKANEFIKRSLSRDPDLWVLEIEDPTMKNDLLG
jgi:hypothetical protein